MERSFLIAYEKDDHVKQRDLADFLAQEPLDAKGLALGAVYEQLAAKLSRVDISDCLSHLFIIHLLEADPTR